MRTRFQQGLDDLRQKLLRMGGLAEQAVDRARQAYIDRDLTRCQMVLEGETLINTSEREIDEAAFDLLAMQQPMAVDLRFILAVTKINSDLERVGDQAVNIAERVMDMVDLPKADLGYFVGCGKLPVRTLKLEESHVADLVANSTARCRSGHVPAGIPRTESGHQPAGVGLTAVNGSV